MPWIEERSRTERLVLVALFAALTWVGAYIRVPILPEVPFTLQTLMVVMAGLILGPRYALYSQGLYVLMGLIGIPVFAGGAGGPGYVLQPTFGFILGFLLAGVLVGWVGKTGRPSFFRSLIAALVGMAAIYAVGLPYLYLIKLLLLHTAVPFWGLVVAMIPFMVGDLVKSLVAAAVAPAVLERVKDE